MQFGIVFRTPAMYRTLLERAGIDLAKRQGNTGWLLPVPATFLVGSNGMVRHAWVDVDFQQRAKPAEVVQLLRALRDGGPAPAPVPSPPHGEPA